MKISKILLNNYRAFYNEKGEELSKYHIDFSNKKNLLIYGENGSGKSSLFKGVKDVFTSSIKPDTSFIENVFSKQEELDDQPFVELLFKVDDETKSYRFSSDPAKTNTNETFLKAIARTRNFMTYRDLLRIHFVEDPEVNLFDFLFAGEDPLLGEIPNPSPSQTETNLKMKDLWNNVSSKPDETNVGDFCSGVNQILIDIRQSLNALLKYFDDSLEIKFDTLTKEMIEGGKPKLKMVVSYYGIELNNDTEQYHHFLNEARLSALAICIFLAAHLSVPQQDYSILFLDDIFTGLDTSNRMPLLDILTADEIVGTTDTFSNHQIILTTYDRQWYELARNYLGQSIWAYEEIFIDRHSKGFDQPAILPGEDNYERALHYFKTKQYPACANHQRKVCEALIKQFLPSYKKYDALPNGDIKPTDKLATLIERLESYMKENSMDFTTFKKLKECLKVVMNPLSHDDLNSPTYRRELELVFVIIKSLKQLENSVVLNAGQKIIMKKTHGKTGVEREYVCLLKSDIRILRSDKEMKYSEVVILPLTQKDTNDVRKKISYEGSIKEVYNKLCHSLKVPEEDNLLVDFELIDGTNLNTLING
ncbi:MAG: AAA family ATPase [Algibacter sp.]